MNVETKQVKLSALKLNPDNPRRIGNKEMERLVKSLQEFPDMLSIREIVVDETMTVLGGNMRLLALKKSGAKECTAKIVTGLTPEQKREFIIKDNSAFGEWDMDLLSSSWSDLPLVDWGVDLPEDWLVEEKTEPADAEPQIDRAAELNKVWRVKTGDLWQIGDHRLLCGDSTKKEDVGRVMGEEKAQMCFTSPPYNAGVSAKLSGNTNIGDNLYGNKYDDNKTQPEYLKLLQGFTDCAFAVCDYLFVNIQVLAGNKIAFLDYWHANADKFADVAIWDKVNAAPQQAQRVMDSRFEFVLIFSHNPNRAIGTKEFRGMVHNVYSGKPQRNNENAAVHAATFPIDFPSHFIDTFTNSAELILDPFIGTGTTMVACQNLNRKCRGIEISPDYCAVILQRMFDAFPGIEIRRIE
jgi:DNA modification methylase